MPEERSFTELKIYWCRKERTCYWCDLNGKKGVLATWLLKKVFTDLGARWAPACDACAIFWGPHVEETMFWPEIEK